MNKGYASSRTEDYSFHKCHNFNYCLKKVRKEIVVVGLFVDPVEDLEI